MPYNPTNPGPVVPPGQYGYPYHAADYGQPTTGVYPGGQPFGGNQYAAQNTPYPMYPVPGHPMPMPMPLDNTSHVQSAYPTGKES